MPAAKKVVKIPVTERTIPSSDVFDVDDYRQGRKDWRDITYSEFKSLPEQDQYALWVHGYVDFYPGTMARRSVRDRWEDIWPDPQTTNDILAEIEDAIRAVNPELAASDRIVSVTKTEAPTN